MAHIYRPIMQEANWKSSRDVRPRGARKRTKWIIACAAALLAVGVVIAFLLLLPHAIVTVQLDSSHETMSLPIAFDSKLREADISTSMLRGRIVNVEVSKTITVEAVSREDIGEPARGVVYVYNRTGKPYDILPDATFRGQQNMEYVPVAAATIPGATVSDHGDIVPGMAPLTIVAQSGGDRGNLSAGRLVVQGLPAELAGKIYAETGAGGITGGASHIVTVVGDEDIERARGLVIEELEEQIVQKLQSTLTIDEAMPEEMLEKIEHISTNPAPHAEAQSFEYTLTITAHGMSFPIQDLIALFTTKIDTADSDKIRLVPKDIDSFTFTEIKRDLSQGTASAEVSVDLISKPKLDAAQLIEIIVGKPVPEVRRVLLSQENIKNVKIVNKFTLFNSLPDSAEKITIEFE